MPTFDPYSNNSSTDGDAPVDFLSSPSPASPTTKEQMIDASPVVEGQPRQRATLLPADDKGFTNSGEHPAAASEQGAEPSAEGLPYEPADLPEHLSAEHAYAASKYWQSKYDTLNTQNASDLEEFRSFRPIVSELMSDPEALSYLSARWSGSQQQPQNGQTPQAPVAESVNLSPAPDDLYSPEGEEWLRQTVGALPQLVQQNQTLTQEINALRQSQQQTTQMSQQQQQINSAVQEAQFTLGMAPADASKFVHLIHERGLGIYDNWQEAGRAYMSNQRPSADTVRQQQAQVAAQNRQSNRMPPTAMSSGGMNSPAPQNNSFLVAPVSRGLDPFAI